VVVRAQLADDLSGVHALDGDITTCWPLGGPLSWIEFQGPTGSRTGGTFEQRGGGVFEARVRILDVSAVGTWRVRALALADCTNNYRTLTGDDLEAAGITASFEVVQNGDTTLPLLHTLSVAPSVVDVRDAGAQVVVRARITDNHAIASLDGPAGCEAPLTRVDATSPAAESLGAPLRRNGSDQFEAVIDVPRLATPGTWSLRVTVVDCAGNTRLYSIDDLAALGAERAFTVLAPRYEFGGFTAPFGGDALAERRAGAGIPVRFSLGGAEGTDVFDAGFPQVHQIDCVTREPLGAPVALAPSEWLFRSLENGVYEYKWKSSPQWIDSCRRLVLGFDDGSRHTADVRFG
jgi:hypothetical protein